MVLQPILMEVWSKWSTWGSTTWPAPATTLLGRPARGKKSRDPKHRRSVTEDFSNRSHKAVIVVTGVILENYESLLVGLGTGKSRKVALQQLWYTKARRCLGCVDHPLHPCSSLGLQDWGFTTTVGIALWSDFDRKSQPWFLGNNDPNKFLIGHVVQLLSFHYFSTTSSSCWKT